MAFEGLGLTGLMRVYVELVYGLCRFIWFYLRRFYVSFYVGLHVGPMSGLQRLIVFAVFSGLIVLKRGCRL